MQQDIFFNTIELSGKDLQYALNSASNQNEKIMVFFKVHSDRSFTPSEVHRSIFDESTPITSVRRSMTVLTKSGDLRKTDQQAIGNYGKPEYKWTYAV